MNRDYLMASVGCSEQSFVVTGAAAGRAAVGAHAETSDSSSDLAGLMQ
jgi:hypothetical protein